MNMTPQIAKTVLAVAISSLMGCASMQAPENNAKVETRAKELTALLPAGNPKVNEGLAPLDITPLADDKQRALARAWLKTKKVDFIPNKKDPRPIAAMEIMKMFRESGINITSALPLDSYFYSGNGLKGADGETALQLILGQMGLDYDVDDKGKYVTIVPMKSRSWVINLGHRTSYSSNSTFDHMCSMTGGTNSSQQGGAGNAQGGQQNTLGQQGGASGASGTGGGLQQGTDQAANNQNNGAMNTAGSSLQTQDDFWGQLHKELGQRLQVLVPTAAGVYGQAAAVPGLSGQPGQTMPGQSTGGTGLYTLQKIGHYSINPVTGQVTIQAPGWLLKQINAYIEDIVLPMYNTSMVFEGTVVSVKATNDESKGFDLTALGKYAGRFGFVLNNNILGGISMGSTSTGIPSASYNNANTLPGGGSAFGIVSPSDNLQIFNGFLSTLGGTEVIQTPIVNTTSGAPVDFGRMWPYWTNQQTQTLAAGNANSNAIATIQNNYIKYEYGSLLRVMPRYDPKTRRVRAQISLLQRPLNGFQDVPSAIMTANGSIQNSTVRIPNIGCEVISSEALLDDGEMIIIGGQVENSSDTSHSGITGAMDVKGLDLFTSKKRETGSRTTIYFAIRVRLTNKPTI